MINFSFKTQRLLIRNITLDDVSSEYLKWLNNDNNKFIINSKIFLTVDDLKKYVNTMICKPNVLFLAIFDKKTKKHIGNIKYDPINLKDKYAILGILIGDDAYKGIGIANEVILNTSSYLHNNFDINKILLGVNKKNIPAIIAYEKIGFVISDNKFLTSKSNESLIYELNLPLQND
jgi:RimJ/RimL family protein N-acetyltransferase